MQQALQFWTEVSNLGGREQSPTGGHEREPELVQVPEAAAKGRRDSKPKRFARISCILGKTPEGR
jgi:hypothetical protein